MKPNAKNKQAGVDKKADSLANIAECLTKLVQRSPGKTANIYAFFFFEPRGNIKDST